MPPLFEIKDVDRRFYAGRLRDFLPSRIIDIHTHCYRLSDSEPLKSTSKRTVSWPSRVAMENPIEDLLETYRLMLPGKHVTPLIFASIPTVGTFDAVNGYCAQVSREHDVPALLFTNPKWSAAETEEKLLAGGFLGAKSYLSLAPDHIPADEIRITDFFPPHQLEVLDRLGLVMMLHVPRVGRLADPMNLAELLYIERTYPNIKLIVAHVGRAYCDHDVGNAFDVLAESKRMYFDICANTNRSVFERLIQCVGPKRILFGSDMPILRMRMRRIVEGGHYVNLVPRGLYGDVSDDPNMGEVDGVEADRLTFFLYEEIDAFRRAAEACRLAAKDVEDVFYNNARRILDEAGGKEERA